LELSVFLKGFVLRAKSVQMKEGFALLRISAAPTYRGCRVSAKPRPNVDKRYLRYSKTKVK